ncbi:MAG: HD domain-containing protein [Oscillospiraceae bacterium]|jgi:(p)ppGpp synthase/HD superfamily hydrolase|nr:HD domain-containing protein [Oscillospiraceae bacterium]
MNLIDLALSIAEKAHAGQTDKGGSAYIDHPRAVAAVFKDDYRQAAALLHDVVEDSQTTLEGLKEAGIPGPVVEAVDALTKRQGETYYNYLDRVKANPIACDVKLADLKHNSQISRIPNPREKDYKRLQKYKEAYLYLTN